MTGDRKGFVDRFVVGNPIAEVVEALDGGVDGFPAVSAGQVADSVAIFFNVSSSIHSTAKSFCTTAS